MRRYLPLLLLVAGCSQAASQPRPPSPAPKFPTLAAGTAVMVTGNSVVMVRPPDGHPFEKGQREFIAPFVKEGDRALILDDDGLPTNDREAKIRMESGPLSGGSYLIRRDHLVPVSTPPP